MKIEWSSQGDPLNWSVRGTEVTYTGTPEQVRQYMEALKRERKPEEPVS